MKKKIVIAIVAALLILCVVLAVSSVMRVQSNVDLVWYMLESGDQIDADNPSFQACKNSRQLKKKLLTFAESTNDPQKMAQMGATLSKIGYEDADVKATFAARIRQMLQQAESTPQVYLQVLALVSDTDEAFYTLSNILAQQDFMAYLEENFTKAIIQKGAGGYYDGKKNENKQYTNELLFTITESHVYSGDFWVYNYESIAYRPSGELWEDELLEQYDEKTVELYYQNKQLRCPVEFMENFASNSYGAEAAYVRGDCVVIIRNGKAYTTQGDILYNREVSAYEELSIHMAAICIPEAAYDDAGEEAMWYFRDNQELFRKLTSQEIAECMPGQWIVYYFYSKEQPMDYYADGTYVEHYENSDREYPWATEEDLLYCRKNKNGDWSQIYVVRQITDDLYMLYDSYGRLELAMKKVG